MIIFLCSRRLSATRLPHHLQPAIQESHGFAGRFPRCTHDENPPDFDHIRDLPRFTAVLRTSAAAAFVVLAPTDPLPKCGVAVFFPRLVSPISEMTAKRSSQSAYLGFATQRPTHASSDLHLYRPLRGIARRPSSRHTSKQEFRRSVLRR